MADGKTDNRPLSPHLTIYRPQLTSMSSIFTRITGNALLVGVVLIVWWLLAASISSGYFAFVDGLMTSWLGQLILIGSLWALWYHLLAGLRHLIWDQGWGLEIGAAEMLGWAVIAGSFVLTALSLLVI